MDELININYVETYFMFIVKRSVPSEQYFDYFDFEVPGLKDPPRDRYVSVPEYYVPFILQKWGQPILVTEKDESVWEERCREAWSTTTHYVSSWEILQLYPYVNQI